MKIRNLVKDKNIYLLLLAAFIISATGLSIDSVQWRVSSNNSGWVSIFQSVMFMSGLFISVVGSNVFKDRILRIAWVFSFVCYLSAIVNNDDWSVKALVVMTFNIFAPPLGISFGKYLMMHIQRTNHELTLFILQIPTLIVGFMLLGISGKFDSDCSFAFFIFMPFIFFFRNDYLKIAFVAFYGILVLLAGKRSVSIAYISSVFIYLFYYLVINKSHRHRDLLKKAVLFCASILAVIIFISYFSSQVQTLMERFRMIEDDGGSGRNDIYELLLDQFQKGSIENLFFGHGYFSVVKDFEIGAHNDFLEILYDYGIFALLLIICLLYRLIAKWVYTTKTNVKTGEYSYVLLVNIVIILVLGMLNCLVTSTYFNYVNYIAVGATLQSISVRSALSARLSIQTRQL